MLNAKHLLNSYKFMHTLHAPRIELIADALNILHLLIQAGVFSLLAQGLLIYAIIQDTGLLVKVPLDIIAL
jgi:hypothetical protein